MVGDKEFQDETQEQGQEKKKQLTAEIEEEESDVFVATLIKNTISTIMLEEVYEIDARMNKFRKMLSRAVLLFAEKHVKDKPKSDRFVDAFRASWRVYKENEEDEKRVQDVFMKEMNNELWISSNSGETSA